MMPVYFNPFGRKSPERMLKDIFYDDSLKAGIRADIIENEDDFVIEAELPGYSKENISIELEDDELVITAKRGGEKKPDNSGARYVMKERTGADVSRTFRVDRKHIEDNVKAAYLNGILTVTLPKKKAAEGAGKITIE